jgi:hypothetical protein
MALADERHLPGTELANQRFWFEELKRLVPRDP